MTDQIDAKYTFAEYQEKAITDVFFKTSDLIDELLPNYEFHGPQTSYKKEKLKAISNLLFLTLGLNEEVGEVAGKLKKIIRNHDGEFTPEDMDALSKECGDVLWYLTALIKELGLNLDTVAFQNYIKLQTRKDNGTLIGSGDNR